MPSTKDTAVVGSTGVLFASSLAPTIAGASPVGSPQMQPASRQGAFVLIEDLWSAIRRASTAISRQAAPPSKMSAAHGAGLIAVLSAVLSGCAETSPATSPLAGTYLTVTGNDGPDDLRTLENEHVRFEISASDGHLILRGDVCGPFEATLVVTGDETLVASNDSGSPTQTCPASEAEVRAWLAHLFTGEVEWLADSVLVTFHREGDLLALEPRG